MTFQRSLDAHNGRWGIFNDLVYVDVGGVKQRNHDFSIGNVGIPASATTDLTLDLKSLIWTVAGWQRAGLARVDGSCRLTGVVPNQKRSTEMLKTSALPLAIAAGCFAGAANAAVVYCTAPGIPAGCVVRPAAPAAAAAAKVAYCTAGCVARPAARAAAVTPGVGAPGRGAVDPGINQPGALGNRGGGAPGVGVVDPGVNQPGAAGNRGGAAVHPGVGAPEAGVNNVGTNGPGVANQNGGVNRAGRR
jgi:hypothetical protein